MREGGRYIVEKGKKPRRVEFTKTPEEAAAEKKERSPIGSPKAAKPGAPAANKTKEA